jgi:hypothetical protein
MPERIFTAVKNKEKANHGDLWVNVFYTLTGGAGLFLWVDRMLTRYRGKKLPKRKPDK